MKTPPLRVGVAGLTHDHVGWILGRKPRGDIEIVGISEADDALAARHAARFGFDPDLVHPTLDAMCDAARPEAVVAFGPIFEHLAVVEACAPRGVHVMVEKPLAVSVAHAQRMADLARAHGIHLLTNYETTWYASVHEIGRRLREGRVGPIRKAMVQDGHRGPVEIGCSPEFLAWLTDPVLNGGGALIDFGCYGANLMTWLMDGRAPERVAAVTRTLKPDVYPKVDDDATVVLSYGDAEAIVQGSWNWPFSRKDMEVYGRDGTLHAVGGRTLRVREPGEQAEHTVALDPRPAPLDDPFAYLEAVVRGRVVPAPHDLGALENNLVVVRILDAARESARTGASVAP